ncbi:MAG: GntR family transcriptional regulator [Slackia sp.]|nr:GntR family transcriptional regulator [Slackia sp.]
MNELGVFHIDEASGVPLWIQIRKRLVFLITSGRFARGERLPSVRELSVNFGVNYNTVNKVYQDLERDGYIFTKRGLGTYVSETKDFASTDFDDEIVALAGKLVDTAVGKGMAIDDVMELVRDQFAKVERRM